MCRSCIPDQSLQEYMYPPTIFTYIDMAMERLYEYNPAVLDESSDEMDLDDDTESDQEESWYTSVRMESLI